MHHTHTYIGRDPELCGKHGVIYTASGHYDPGSIEAGAFIFETDEIEGDSGNVAVYCDRSDVCLYYGLAT